jgi:PhoD-like phosphatase
MHNRKTQTTDGERRRFLDASWSGVAGTLALALMPGRELRAAPRLGTNLSRSAWPRAIHNPTVPCCGRAWRHGRPSRPRSVTTTSPCTGALPWTQTCGTSSPTAWPPRWQGSRIRFTSKSKACVPAFDSTRRQGTAVPVGFNEETVDLRTYRLRHALHKLDPDLQAAHARFPFAVIWDDHEVANDYSGLAPEFALPWPEFTARRTAAYRDYYEHMPIRERDAKTQFRRLRIHRRLRYGRLAETSLLDDRQYRSDNPCGDGESLRCAAALGSEPTMLGREQEQWLTDGLGRSRARWNIVAQQLLVAQLARVRACPARRGVPHWR